MQLTTLPEWIEPLAYATHLQKKTDVLVFLHSSRSYTYSGRYSFLAWEPSQTLQGDDLQLLASTFTNDQSRHDNMWFGYLGYGLKNKLENLSADQPSVLTFPDFWFSQFNNILVFDHVTTNVSLISDSLKPQDIQACPQNPQLPPSPIIANLESTMSKEQYLENVDRLRQAIIQGDILQANLTRKFWGNFAEHVDAFDCFLRLTQLSPSPYSAFIRWDGNAILSSSPERFLSMDNLGHVNARPIKGSLPRHTNPLEDNKLKVSLQSSLKDQSENLMIVDLMRNDLSKSCELGSIKVPSLFEVSSHPNIHHMSSSIIGVKKPDITTLSLVAGCFPPGSMTGAPKIKAMEWCSNIENLARGVYSGCLGWFGGDGSCDLSVIIRTILMQGNQFEFQVGGAIVYDSTPLGEWQETMTKAKGLCETLGIVESQMSF